MIIGKMSKLRTKEDREQWERYARWEVVLSDGTTVYRNDEEIGESAWVLLGEYLKDNPRLSITQFKFGFRDNYRTLKENAEGYFFRNSVVGSLAGSQSSFLVGILQDGKILVEKWEIPEMLYQGTEERTIESANLSLITNGLYYEKGVT